MSQPTTQRMRVATINDVSDITRLICLTPSEAFDFTGGQYIMMGVFPDDAEPEMKPFSIASASRTDGQVELHVRKHEESAWMDRLFDLAAGDDVVVTGPSNQYQLDDGLAQSGTPIILVAGGTGFAPMKAMLDELLKQDAQQPIEFYWGARVAADLYLNSAMQEVASQHDNVSYIPVLSEETPEHGKSGLVHQQVLTDHQNQLNGQRIYLCGPWPMVEAAKADFIAAGLDENAFN